MTTRLGVALSAFAVACAALALAWVGPSASAASVAGGGYVVSVTTSTDLNCGADVQNQGQAFAGGLACGTIVAAHGKILQPATLPIGSSSASLGIPWAPVSQAISGSGSASDPYVILTTVMGWGIKVTQADRFVAGEASFQTTYQITNTAASGTSLQLYHVGDCSFAGGYATYGEYDANLRMVTCRKPAADGSYSSKAAGTQFAGVGARYFYGTASDMWTSINSRSPLPDSIGPGANRAIDGVLGVGWDKWLEAGQSATFTMRSVFQPEVGVPPTEPPPPSPPPSPPPPPSGGDQPTAPNRPYYPGPGSSGSSGGDSYWPNQIIEPDPIESSATPTPSAEPTATPTGSPSPRPSASPTSASPTQSRTPGPTPDPGDDDGGGFLTSPLLYLGIGVLSAGGFAGVFLLRRHGQPE
jgi:hypothetical protein